MSDIREQIESALTAETPIKNSTLGTFVERLVLAWWILRGNYFSLKDISISSGCEVDVCILNGLVYHNNTHIKFTLKLADSEQNLVRDFVNE